MSQANEETATRAIDAFNRGDVDGLAALATPDFEWSPSMVAIEGTIFKGREGIERYFESLQGAWEKFHVHVGRFDGDDDVVVMLGRLEGLGIGSGVPVFSSLGMVFDFRDGAIRRIRGFLDHEEALRAAGLELATSDENLELVRRIIDVMDAEGFEAALPLFLEAAHPDVKWREDPDWPGATVYEGVEQVRKVIQDRMETLDFDQRTEDLIGAGDKVLALVRWVGRGRASGAAGEMSMAMVWTVRDHAITKLEFFLDRDQAFAAVGVTQRRRS